MTSKPGKTGTRFLTLPQVADEMGISESQT